LQAGALGIMEIRMEHTDGLGRPAEVWVDGVLLTVCDGISEPGRPVGPGELTNVKLQYVSQQGYSLADYRADNDGKRKELDPVRRWTYVGYGQIVSIMPVVVDFGTVQMEDANWTSDESMVGQYVAVPIDRLEIVPANQPDWPEDMR